MAPPPISHERKLDATVSAGIADGSGAMFDRIAERYDLLNRLLSFGTDQRWRKKTVAALELAPELCVLDLATGTADLAIAVARAEPSVRVVGLDSAERMLAVGRRKVENLDLADRIELVQGDARAIPFEPASFDRISMAFGIRNVSDRQGALQEMVRVGRPNARLAILELSEPRRGWSGPFARFHVHTVVPWLGSVLSGAPEYRYLQRSIERFPEPEAFASTMRAAGIDDVRIVPLTFGVCHLYLGRLRGPA